MTNSKQLAGLIGPTLIALGLTEALNLEMFAHQIAPVVYLNGTILFVVGLALVGAHNHWTWDRPVIVTGTAWSLWLGGLYRMVAPEAPQASVSALSYAMFATIAFIGAFLSYKA